MPLDADALAEVEALSAFAALCRSACLEDGPGARGLTPVAGAAPAGTVAVAAASDDGRPRSDAFQAARVAQRVLERTTREDLRHRRDVGLVLEFIGDRLRESVLLRVAAAVLVMQVTVVPLIAYHMLRERAPTSVNIDFEPSPAELAARLADDLPGPPEVIDGRGGASLEDELEALRLSEELAADRQTLRRVADLLAEAPQGGGAKPAPETPVGVALAALTEARSVAEPSSGRDGAQAPLPQKASRELLVAVLVAEAGLFAVDGGQDWHGVAGQLERLVALVETGGEASGWGAGERALAARALDHARRSGIGRPLEAAPLVTADGSSLFSGAWALSWIDTLEAALRRADAGADDGYVRAWLLAVEAQRLGGTR